MAAVQETVDRVRSIDVEAYKYGFVSRMKSELPQGALTRILSGSSLRGRVSRNGCSHGGSTHFAVGGRWKNRNGAG